MRAIATDFKADAVYLQVLSVDGLLVPVAWHAHQAKLRGGLQDAAEAGNLRFRARGPGDARCACADLAGRRGAPSGSPLDGLATDAWIEGVSLRAGDRQLQGVLIVVGSPSKGCSPLSDLERRTLANCCALALAATSEAHRAERLEGQLAFLTQTSRNLASRKTIFERLKVAVSAAQTATGFDSIQLLTWDPTGRKLLLNVLYIHGVGFVPDTTWDQMTREELQEGSRRFLADPSPVIFPDPAELDTVPPNHRRWMIDNGIKFLVFVPSCSKRNISAHLSSPATTPGRGRKTASGR